jgi:hypothetical protein
MTSLRFVLGLLVMGAATRSDTMGIFVTTQFQGIAGITVAALLLMRRQSNPFAGEQGAGSVEQGVGKWGRKKHGAWSVEHGVEEGLKDKETERPKDQEGEGIRHAADGERQLSADGGTVRTMPIRTPKRIASWMPQRVRAAVVAQYAVQEVTEGVSVGQKDGVAVEGSASAQGGSGVTRERPRQVAVPYQNYRRYRG